MSVTIKTEYQQEHPWGVREGVFDIMFIDVSTKDEFNAILNSAQSEFWKIWVSDRDSENPGTILYKPSGIDSGWEDDPSKPHTGGRITGTSKARIHEQDVIGYAF